MTPPLRFLLVVPGGAAGLQSGGGQRSAIFYRAMAALAPTDVLILSDRDRTKDDHPAFPGAHVRLVKVEGVGARPANPMRRLLGDVMKLLYIQRQYQASPAVAKAIADMQKKNPYSVVIYRFFQCQAAAQDASFDVQTRHALDLDDRDDQKYIATLTRRFGTGPHVTWLANRVRRQIGDAFAAQLPGLARIWATDPSDRVDTVDVPFATVPNVPFFMPAETPTSAAEGAGLVFVGTAGHPPNVNGLTWFLRTTWPLVRATCPDATLRIVGAGGWSGDMLDDAALDGVEIVGRVEDIGAEYLRARASICPIADGGGSKIKVIESCAFARPAICTTHSRRGFEGALANLLPAGDSPRAFADHCIALLRDPAAAAALGTQLRAAQQDAYSLTSAIGAIQRDLTDMLNTQARPAVQAASRTIDAGAAP